MQPAARFQIIDGGLDRADVQTILREHLADMYATSPADSVHALDLDALRALSFWTVVDSTDRALAVGALAVLGDGEAEVKSMRTTVAARGRGAATFMLNHLVQQAREHGARVLRLETGSQEFFAPARRLYTRAGFVPTGPYGGYGPDPNSCFYALDLAAD